MNLGEFLILPTEQVAQLVRASGPKVCVFPINGTRRWFALEHASLASDDGGASYLNVIARRHIEVYQLLFEHGLDTLLTPAFGPDILERGDDYVRMAAEGLGWLAEHPRFVEFYKRYDIRVRFYGDYARFFAHTPYAYLLDLFDGIVEQTARHKRHRLFFGLFAHDATETVAELAVSHHSQHGAIPDKRRLVELYYGEYVEPVSLFIGFDKPSVFDMPLVASGNEDLYFTVCPSLYMNPAQLRTILYDHLYVRQLEEVDYLAMEVASQAAMAEFYRLNQGRTIGVGARHQDANFWYPLPQVVLPASLVIQGDPAVDQPRASGGLTS